MNVAVRRSWRIPEFLAWEERQEIRYEFDGFQPVAMVGGTLNHNIIVLNLASVLRDRLRGKPCRAFAEGVKIEVAGRIRYPDVVVSCSSAAGNATVLPGPVVVFEVLSEGTAQTDRIEKNEEYRDTPSILRYVMLEQNSRGGMMFAREGERWVGSLIGADDVIAMPEIGAELSMAEIYEGVELAPESESGGPAETGAR